MSPDQLQRLLQDAVAHHRAGRLEQADAIYTRVRAVAPRNFDAWHLAGVIAIQHGRSGDAVELLTKAFKLGPQSAVCAMRLGLAHLTAGHTAQAEAHLRQALQLDPNLAEAWDNLAYCFKTQDRLADAIECHKKVVSLKPDFAVGWYNYGLTLSLSGKSELALPCHERALKADPGYAHAHYGMAQAYQQLNMVPEAIAAYDRFLAVEPRHNEAQSYRLFALNYLEDLPREKLFAEHVAYGRAFSKVPVPKFANSPDPGRRLRVAVLSPDFRSHSCAYFIEPLLRHLDRSKFELYLYHDHFREDAITRRFQAMAAVWRRMVGLSAPALEKTIRGDRPDIIIDLAGHTGMTNRLPVFAQHLAPVQITYLGYPNTTGLPAIGYRFTDAIADPPGEADAFATEKLVRFAPTAWCYQPLTEAPPVAEPPCAAGGPVTFGCFNNLGKITDTMFRLWARLLKEVPGSRLLFKGRGLGDSTVRGSYTSRMQACGLPMDRVDLLERTEGTGQHMALYGKVDIALDTFPYHGTTTTCESLWMGVPVVTLRGDRHISRVSASLLAAIGRPEWIASTPDDYLRIVVGLASDPAKLGGIRADLRDEMRRSPLLSDKGQSECFAAALRSCWQEWCAKQAPAAPAPDRSEPTPVSCP